MPYFAHRTFTKNEQRDMFMRLVMASRIQFAICVYFDDPDAQCTAYFSRNKRLLAHIERFQIKLYAVNNEAKLDFREKVDAISKRTIRSSPAEFAELLDSYILPNKKISVLWYDHCGTPNPAYLRKDGKETMQELLHRLVRDRAFARRATVMMNYSTRIGGNPQLKFDRAMLLSVTNSSYFMARYPPFVQYRGKAYESGAANSAGTMIFQTMVLRRKI